MRIMMDEIPRAGDPCPNKCMIRKNNGRRVPERLAECMPGSDDGEISCPSCWDSWNTIAGEHHGMPHGS